jgi:hypothetical protein
LDDVTPHPQLGIGECSPATDGQVSWARITTASAEDRFAVANLGSRMSGWGRWTKPLAR